MPHQKLLIPLSEIADRLGCKRHRIAYITATRQIKPAQRAGNCRLFDEDAVRRIEKELKRIDVAKRQGAADAE